MNSSSYFQRSSHSVDRKFVLDRGFFTYCLQCYDHGLLTLPMLCCFYLRSETAFSSHSFGPSRLYHSTLAEFIAIELVEVEPVFTSGRIYSSLTTIQLLPNQSPFI